MGNTLAVYGWVALGLLGFLVLEQFLHWHHCHRPLGAHRPFGYLILLADLVPQFTTQEQLGSKVAHTTAFAVGLGGLYAVALLAA